MSGLGVPLRTASATATVASGVSLSGMTWPVAMTSATGGCTIGTSNASPLITCFLVPLPAPNVALTVWPGLELKIRNHALDRRADAARRNQRDFIGVRDRCARH